MTLDLFLPCAAGVEGLLAQEVDRLLLAPERAQAQRGGVRLHADAAEMRQLNLHSRLAQRVLLQLAEGWYRDEQGVYDLAHEVPWEDWLRPSRSIKVEVTSRHSPLKSLNFAALRVKDALCDRLRERLGARPDVDTQHPDVRVFLHLDAERATLYLDSSGEPLFKRGWRQDQGDAPLKETLAAAMIEASGWDGAEGEPPPFYDPCCGSGTLPIEAAQRLLRIAPGLRRRFAFEKFEGFDAAAWQAQRQAAQAHQRAWPAGAEPIIFGSDVAFRMVDFARRNAERAGVAAAIALRGGDALQRDPPCARAGLLMLNPPYGERLAAAGVAGQDAQARAQRGGRGTLTARSQAPGAGRQAALQGDGNAPRTGEQDDFFAALAAHWKRHYTGWSAWILSPDNGLPGRMRLRESRRVPLWNGPIECRLLRFDMMAGKVRKPRDSTPDGDA